MTAAGVQELDQQERALAVKERDLQMRELALRMLASNEVRPPCRRHASIRTASHARQTHQALFPQEEGDHRQRWVADGLPVG